MKYYFGVAEPTDEGWWISFPSLPGIISAGKDWTELMDNARDALVSAFEAMAEEGTAPPPDAVADPASASFDPSQYRNGRAVMVAVPSGATALQVDLDDDTLNRLDQVAARTSSSRAALLRHGAKLVLDLAG